MRCSECHKPDAETGNFLSITFDADCKRCHARELEFDVLQFLGPAAPPAPHARDVAKIRQFIRQASSAALGPVPLRPVRFERLIKSAEDVLFQRKCVYCHQMQGYADVKKVNVIIGRFVPGKPEGEPWLLRGEFDHRSHEAVACESCHTRVRVSDFEQRNSLVPAVKSCLPCHAASRAGLNRCPLCHLYHNREQENERRRPIGDLAAEWPPSFGFAAPDGLTIMTR